MQKVFSNFHKSFHYGEEENDLLLTLRRDTNCVRVSITSLIAGVICGPDCVVISVCLFVQCFTPVHWEPELVDWMLSTGDY